MASLKEDAHAQLSHEHKLDGPTLGIRPNSHVGLQPKSDMTAPSLKVGFLIFLFMSCLVTAWNYFSPFWKGSTSPLSSLPLSSTGARNGHWVDTWTAAPQSVQYQPAVIPPFRESDLAFRDTTIRQTLQISIGAEQIRLRLSNKFGLSDLPITHVTIAFPKPENGRMLGSRSIDVETLQTVTFSDSRSVIIPDGALAVSDPISFNQPIPAGQVLSVSIYIREGQEGQYITSHFGSGTSTWLQFGDYTRAAATIGGRHHTPHWFFISAVEAWKDLNHHAFAVIGDSITEGRGGPINRNTNWPRLLFDRMQETPGLTHLSVVNQGAGGNQLLHDGRGPNGASRIDRDVLAQSGVRYVMIFEGVNDIGHAGPTAEEQSKVEARLIHYYKQIITRIHAFGIPVFGSTITPFNCETTAPNHIGGDPIREQTRLKINEWIRSSGSFDAVVDFDAAIRDPRNVTRISPDLHMGDCLHPNEKGFFQLSSLFPLEVFERFRDGVDNFV